MPASGKKINVLLQNLVKRKNLLMDLDVVDARLYAAF